MWINNNNSFNLRTIPHNLHRFDSIYHDVFLNNNIKHRLRIINDPKNKSFGIFK